MIRIRSFITAMLALPKLLGICIGIALSLVLVPLLDNRCSSTLNQRTIFEKRDSKDSGALYYRGDERHLQSLSEMEHLLAPEAETDERIKDTQQHMVRPRFLSSELNIREKLFVGILSNAKTVETLGVAMNRTLAHILQKFVLFTDAPAKPIRVDLPVVLLTEPVSDASALHMWRYVAREYGTTYDWYYFAPDSTYVRADRLVEFLDHVGVVKHLMVGRPVVLDSDNTRVSSCDFNAGVLLSQGVMSYLGEHLDWCLRNAMPGGSNTEYVRTCLAHVADQLNISCTDRLNEYNYTYYTNTSLNLSSEEELTNLSSNTEFSQGSLSVSPVYKDTDIYKLHRYFAERSMRQVRVKIKSTEDEIRTIAPHSPEGSKSLVWPLGVDPPPRAKTRYDVNRWHYFTDTQIFLDNDFNNVKELVGVDKLDVTDIIKTAVDRLNDKSKLSNQYTLRYLANGYRRYEASRGMEYILDLMLNDRSSGMDKSHRFHLLRPLGRVEIVPMPYVTENTRVSLLLPVTPEEKDNVLSFLDAYAHTCLEAGDNAYLLVVFVYDSTNQGQTDIYVVIKSMIAFYENRYKNGARITWMSVNSEYRSDLRTPFLVLDAVSRRLPPESLVIRCTVGMDLSIKFLNRVRMNTISGWQVFFPIGYWLYRPSLVYEQKPYPTSKEINPKSGRYDRQQYVHAGFYISDYWSARQSMIAASVSSIDIDLYDLFIRYHTVHILRAVEPALRLQFSERICDSLLEPAHRAECQSTRANGLATRAQLAMLVFEYQQKLDQMQLNVMHEQHGENVKQMKPEMLLRK